MSQRWTIYCHTHIATGRRYIGLTSKTMLYRWNQHVANAKKKTGKGCRHFWNAIRSYGSTAFSHEALCQCQTLEDANATEIIVIAQYDTTDPTKGFNLTRGGGLHDQPHDRSNPWDDPEYRVKQAAVDRSHLHTPRAIANLKASMDTTKSKSKRSAIVKEIMSRPEVRALRASDAYKTKTLKHLKEAINGPGMKESKSQQSKAMWASSDYRKQNAILWEDPVFRAYCQQGLTRGAQIQINKTHCRNGHEYTATNIYINPRGSRECKICRADAQARHKLKN